MTETPAAAVRLEVNGRAVEMSAEPRETLADALRRTQRLRSIRLGCEHGACGACTVRMDGRTVRSCMIFAVQADGARVETAEGLIERDETARRLVAGFTAENSFQCGFCATGMLMTATELLGECPRADQQMIRDRIAGNLCRCTGYQSVVAGVLAAVDAADEETRPTRTGEER